MTVGGRLLATLVVLFIAVETATAQDALRGKRLYLDAAGEAGTGVSCVDCHGGLPGGAFGIGAAADDPAMVETAIATVPQMAPFRGRLMANDFADLAAYIGEPGVASPDARVTTYALDGEQGAPDRIQFGDVDIGDASRPAIVELRNAGTIAFTVIEAPAVSGTDADEFPVEATDCVADLSLAPAQSCRVSILFSPIAVTGARTARIAVAHDWVRGHAAVALFGHAHEPLPPPVMPEPSSGCVTTHGSDTLPIASLIVAIAIGSRRRTGARREHQPSRARTRSTTCAIPRAFEMKPSMPADVARSASSAGGRVENR